MEDFLLQLEMNYSISLINERSYDFFVHPVPNNEKVQSLLLKFGLSAPWAKKNQKFKHLENWFDVFLFI